MKIAGLGERWPGSPGHTKTEALIRTVLRTHGARVESDDFEARTPRGVLPVHNMIGKFNDSGDPKQPILILAGHYDTLFQPGFIGANDGGSSTAILLAFAEALDHQKTKMQVWLVFTDLEEALQSFTSDDGLYGSRHLAAKLRKDGTATRVKGMFLLDMIGDKALGVARETGSDEMLQDVIAQAAEWLGLQDYFFSYEASIIDDHVPFIEAGIPSVDIVDAQFGRMGAGLDGMGELHHSKLDTLDKLSQRSLEIVGKTVLLTLELLDGSASTAPSNPSRAPLP